MVKFVFSSFPDFSDNAFSITKYMIESKIDGKYVWLLENYQDLEKHKSKARNYLGADADTICFVKKKSLRGVWHYLTSRFSFNTHGCFEQLPLLFYQTKINLWHGMPLKNIGHLSGNKIRLKMDYTLSTAPVFDPLIAAAFQLKKHSVLPLGLPRNDLFFQASQFSIKQLVPNSKAVIVWFPTYRKSIVGDIRTDGKYDENLLGGFNQRELVQLDKELTKINSHIVIKLHPMDILNKQDYGEKFSNIMILTQEKFEKLNVEINDFLKEADGLITDYSSVYFDYLLTGKPMALISKDDEEYGSTRGFISEDVIKHFIGFPIDTVHCFIKFINNLEEIDSFDRREYFNKYDKMGNNSKELIKKLRLL